MHPQGTPVIKTSLAYLSIAAAFVLSACGGGGGGGGASISANPVVVSGVASKGLLKRADVCAFAVTSGVQGTQLGKCSTTDDSGNFTVDLGGYTGTAMLQASGGTYIDEASGNVVNLSAPLRTALVNVTASSSAAITGLTEVAFQVAAGTAGGLSAANIQAATIKVQNNFGVSDIVGTMPVNALTVPPNATTAQKTYSLALASVSQYLAARPNGSTLATALQELKTCLADPTNGCALGGSTVGAILSAGTQSFVAQHSEFSSLSSPVASFGSVTVSPGIKSVAVRVFAAAPNNSCPNGGITVVSGIDSNGNGVLDTAEGTNTQIVCNGTNGTNGTIGSNGANGLTALVAVAAEPAGGICAAGGSKVVAGLDTNTNNLLDGSEISSTSYICSAMNGTNGTNGTNGVNGLNTLVQIVSEAAGANCTNGGKNLKSGLDTNSNGILESSEVTSSAFICNGTSGVSNVAVASGHVSDGYVLGSRVTLDINDDRICDAAEPNTTTDGNGGFYFDPNLGQHMLCASGGVDVALLRPFVGQLTAPAGSTQITPLTTLVMTKVNSGMPQPVFGTASPALAATVTSSSGAIANALGLSGIDLLTADPIAAASASPKLIQTTVAVETLLEQTAASVAVAGGTTGFSTGLYGNTVSALTAVLSSSSSPVLDLTSATTVDSLVDSTVTNVVSRSNSALQPANVSALAAHLISNMTRAVGTIPAAQYAATGGAVDVAVTIKQFSDSLLNIVEANRFSLLKPTSIFGCGSCLTVTQLQQLSSAATNLASSAVPNANSLYLDLSTITVNGAIMQTPTANSALNTVNVVGNLSTVTIQTSGTPATATASAGITITSGRGGGQWQMVIDTVNVSTVNGKPFLSVPSTAKLYAYLNLGGVTTATFSNVGSLLSTDANGLVSIDMAGLLGLKIGNLPTDFKPNSNYKVSVGITGIPVAIKNAVGTALAVVEDTSYTAYGTHLSLGADFLVSSTAQASGTPSTPVINTLNLNLSSLAVNDITVSTLPYAYYGNVTLAGPMSKVALQVTGTPVTATGSAGISVSSDTGWNLQMVIDKVSASTVNGTPVLNVPPTAKLFAYYGRNSQQLRATFSNVSALLATDANGVVSLDITALLALVKTMDPTPLTSPITTGMMNFAFGFSGIPVSVQAAGGGTSPSGIYIGATTYGAFIGDGAYFSVKIQ